MTSHDPAWWIGFGFGFGAVAASLIVGARTLLAIASTNPKAVLAVATK